MTAESTLEDELSRARDLAIDELADAVESIGFECTRCGACCTREDGESEREREREREREHGDAGEANGDEHTATVFPDEVRNLEGATGREWRDVARPMPYGLREVERSGDGDGNGDGSDGGDGEPEPELEGETFEWALQTDSCGDCVFYEEDDRGVGACVAHDDRPLICRTYPFSVALGGTSQPMGEAVDEEGLVRAHECEGLGRDISRADAEDLARALKERAIRELEEAIAVRDEFEPANPGPGEIVVHDSEGAKRADGTPLEK